MEEKVARDVDEDVEEDKVPMVVEDEEGRLAVEALGDRVEADRILDAPGLVDELVSWGGW
jgi:hypothetical protein